MAVKAAIEQLTRYRRRLLWAPTAWLQASNTASESLASLDTNGIAGIGRSLDRARGRESVMGGTDCGFAQSPFARRVHPSIMWAKLNSLAEGARIATQTLWDKRAAA